MRNGQISRNFLICWTKKWHKQITFCGQISRLFWLHGDVLFCKKSSRLILAVFVSVNHTKTCILYLNKKIKLRRKFISVCGKYRMAQKNFSTLQRKIHLVPKVKLEQHEGPSEFFFIFCNHFFVPFCNYMSLTYKILIL
jgi:hypothetical protein